MAMKSSKASEGSATKSNKNQFRSAVLKLAAAYTLVFGVVVLTMSVFLYTLFAGDIHEDMGAVFAPGSEQAQIIDYHKGVLMRSVVGIDLLLLATVTVCSYYLAKLNLNPIQVNYFAQKRFIADASHELRTPLAILKTDIEVNLEDTRTNKETKTVLKGYLVEVNKMTMMVNNLLLLSKFDSSQITIKKDNFDLSQALVGWVRQLQILAKSRKVGLKTKTPPSIKVLGDRQLLEQALRNVVKNAIEHSQVNNEVKIELKRINNMVTLSVSDNGRGMNAEEVGRLFERFYRGEKTKSSHKSGSGLGMAITKEIIEKHGGEICVVSKLGVGTTITIELPCN